jgi:hypothetical protein
VKHGIVVLVTLLELLGKQFEDVLAKNAVSAVSVTVAHTTNELFEVNNIPSVEDQKTVLTADCSLQHHVGGACISVNVLYMCSVYVKDLYIFSICI